MSEKQLTAAQCDEVEKAMREDAAELPAGSPDQAKLVEMADAYRILGEFKRLVLRQAH